MSPTKCADRTMTDMSTFADIKTRCLLIQNCNKLLSEFSRIVLMDVYDTDGITLLKNVMIMPINGS